MQLLFSLYKWFILPHIAFKIILKIVEMSQNVEYPTLPLNKNVKFSQHFRAKNPSKSSNKGQRYLIIIWLHANYLFSVKIHVKCDFKKMCKSKKKKKKKEKKMWNVGKPTLPLNENVVCHRRSCYRPTLT